MRRVLLLIVPLLFCVFSINAQNSDAEKNAAMSLVSASKAKLGLASEDLGNVMVSNTYYDNTTGIRMVYLTQTYQGIPVFNQMLVLAFKGDKLVSQQGAFNHSLEKFAAGKSATPSVTAESAVQSALSDRGLHASQMAAVISTKDNGRKVEFSNMGVSRENITAQLMWTPVENSEEINLSWHVYIIPKTSSDYWMIRVDAVNNSVLGLDNYTDYDHWGTPDVNGRTKYPGFAYGNTQANVPGNKSFDFKKADDPSLVTTASYRVIPFPAEAPSFPNGAHAIRTDPWTAAPGNATTLRWHTGLAAADYSHTRSNNVFAYQDRSNDNNGTIADAVTSSTAFPNLTFDHTPNYTVDPTQTTPVPNQQFNTTNLFYWNNVIHDIMYIYGFTEPAANFQDDNLGRGGNGNDHVNAEAQDGGGSNNANFATPADGGSGRMQMYLWTGGTPNRDGDVDNGIIVHEYGHGISNRLTGGGSGACLGNAEQMGEGWSDYYGLMFTQDWATATLNTGFNSPRGIGTYALFQPPTGLGIRTQRYCTDFTVNNKVYLASLPAGPHPRGEIWCATLWDMTWNIINQVGTINPNIYNFAGGGGNAIALRLVTEGLKMQQCNPGFISGRNGILAADQALYGGLYSCAIWEAFRRRGMGAFASEGSTSSVTDQVPDFTAPISLGASVSASTIPEGSNLTYTNSITTCGAVTNYTLRDTLPTNVTYVSGGTYDAPNRVVSFAVNQAAGTTNYPFIVNVNPGSYFPPVTLFTEPVATATIPAAWTTAAPAGTPWTVSTTVSNSAPNSFYVDNVAVAGDSRLTRTAAFALPLNSYPELSFWHRWNTEDGWDGGVVEISTNGGTTWNDVGAANFTLNGYNSALGAAPTNALSGRAAFTGLQSTFINSKINLSAYNGQSIMIRFRFGSDDNTTAPTAPAGWWVDDITLSYKAAVNMRSSLFNASNTRVSFKDMVTEITQVVNCAPVINQQPVDVTTCAGSSVSYTCVGSATGGVTYQWQLSTTGIGGTYTNLANGAPYSGVTTSTLTINPTAVGLNGNYYRCVVTGTCAPNATSNPAGLFVAAGSTPGTVTPANSNVCGTTNSGTLTVAGFNGNVIRWESATNIAGPWTTIANTTTTYTFNNITQTMYYRAVTQFGTCAEANSSIATVTFAAASPMVIVANPGTTLCEGDPTLLTVYEAGGAAPVSITHSSSNTITAGNSVACNTGTTGNPNSYWRAYNLNNFPTVTGPYTINSVTFGIEAMPGAVAPLPITVRLYNQTGAPFPGGTRTQIASQIFSVAPQTGTLYTATFTTPVTVPNTSTVIVEVANETVVTGVRFFIGSNAAAETDISYLSSAACAIANPTPVGTIGFPNMHIILGLNGTVPGAGGIVTGGTFLWTPAAGLSSTTSNPVAASPMNTTTYTVSHNNGAGCVRQANVTITVNKRPVVTTQPANRVSCVGTAATFTVGATGTGLTYQWQVATSCAGPWTNLTNVAPYSGVNTATLTVNPVTQLMSGNVYRVIVNGTCAPWTPPTNVSNCATLTVNPNPVITLNPVGPVCGGVAGINGTALTVTAGSPPIPGNASANSGTISVPIPDGTGAAATSNLTIAGVPANATITEIKVNMNINHTWVGDVDVNLRAPNNAILNLVGSLDGGTGSNSTDNFTNTAFSSLGGAAISGAPAPRTGTFAAEARAGYGPVGFIQTVTTWAGLVPPATPTAANGQWTLAAGDFVGTDVGTITNWSISIDYTTPGSGGTPVLTYVWSPLAGLYTNPNATTAYTGTNLATVYAAPTVQTTYTVRGTDVVTGCFTDASVLVNYTPPAPTVTPSSVAMCLGDAAVKLKASTSTPGSATFTSGTVNIAIPDGPTIPPVPTSYPAVTSNITVSGIPAGATITAVRARFNVTHAWVSDLVMALKAPNGQIVNLSALLNRTNQAGANFTNTVISSASTTPLGGAAPYTGTFADDAAGATFTALGFTWPGGPTGYVPTTSQYADLYNTGSVNGVWSIGIYDAGAPDGGTLNNWSLDIDYTVGVVASAAVWSPAAGLFSDAAATVPYVAGTRVDSVWTRPTPSGVYNYQVTVNNLIAVNATPSTPLGGTNTNAVILFNVRNNNAIPVTFSTISSNASVSGAVTSTVFYNATAIAGPPAAITAANGWNQFGTGASTVTAGVNNLLISGLTLVIPPNTTYGIALQMVGAGGPAYTNGTGTVTTYTNNGCSIIVDGNVGWGGFAVPAQPLNNPRNFNGSVTLVAAGPGTCQSPATTVVVSVNQPTVLNANLPANQTICTDKVATFTAEVTAGTGPHTYQWQVSTTGPTGTFTNVNNGGVYSGATTATLTITAPPTSMSGYAYRAIVNGAAPCAAQTSRVATLTVNPLPVVVISAAPHTSLLPGLQTTLSSTITPNPAATFSWIRNGVVLTSPALGVLSGLGTGTINLDVDGMGDYQLRVTDVNGCTSTSNTITIKDSASGRCYIYPNPTSGKFQVRYYSTANNVLPRTLTIFDSKGDRVFTQFYQIGRPYDRMDVDMRAYGKGLYWVEIGDLNGNRLTMCRVVIQ